MTRSLKHMLTIEDGRLLWNAKRDGWQVSHRSRLSRRNVGVEFHDENAGQTGARLGAATCRVCGGKIAAGAARFVVLGDPSDNAWTMQRWYVHANPCVEGI